MPAVWLIAAGVRTIVSMRAMSPRYPHLSFSILCSIACRFLVVASRTKSLAILDVSSTTKADCQHMIDMQFLCLFVSTCAASVFVAPEMCRLW